MTYKLEVYWSNHDLLQDGITEAGKVGFLLEAESVTDACLLGCQMVYATMGQMPTGVLLLDWPSNWLDYRVPDV